MKVLSVALIALAPLLAPLCPARETAGFPDGGPSLPPDAALRLETLPSGVRIAILPNAEPKGRASLRLLVLAGSLHESDSQRGLAHFLEHMAFNGSTHFPPGELVKYFQRIGMGFGNDTNAYTTFDHTAYQIELPTADAESLAEGVRVLADYAGGLLLPAEEIDRERGVILAEKRDRDTAAYRTYLAELSFLLPGSRVAERAPIGTEDVIRNAPRSEFLDFYDTWYRPERCIVIAVGDFEPELAREAIAHAFGALTPRRSERPAPEPGPLVSERSHRIHVHHEAEAPSTRVTIQSVLPLATIADGPEKRRIRLLLSLANAALGLRLDTLSEREKAPFTSGYSAAQDAFELATNASIELIGPDSRWSESLKLAASELRKALAHGFSEDEVATVVAASRNALEEGVRSAPTRRSPGLAGQLARSLASWEVFTHPEQDRDLLVPVLDTVTPETLHAALAETWAAPEQWLVFVTGNQPTLSSDEVAATFSKALQDPVEAPQRREALRFAYEDWGSPVAPSSVTELVGVDASRLVFPNGIVVNFKQTAFEANRIRFSARIGTGRLGEPADKQGLALLADLAANAGGLGRHSPEDLRRLMAGRSVSIGLSVGEDAFILAGSASPKDLGFALQLLAANLSDPGLRPEGFRLAARQVDEIYAELETEPSGVFQLEFARALTGDHRFGLPPRTEIVARTPDEVREWLVPALTTGAVELTLVGDCTLEQVRDLLSASIGTLPARQPRAMAPGARSLPHSAKASRSDLRRPTTSVPKALVSLAWLTDDRWDIGRTRRLGALAEVFSNRILFKIREELGDAYSPSAYHLPSETYPGLGWLSANVECAPDQVDRIVATLRGVASELATGSITEDETARAVRPILTGIQDNFRNNGYWLGSVLNGSAERPERLTWPSTLRSDFESMTPADLNSLAARYLGEPALVWSVRFEKETP